MLSVLGYYATMSMAHVLTQADIGNCNQIGTPRLNGSDRFLNDSVVRVGAARRFVFLFGNPEKENRLQSQVLRRTRLVGNFLYGQLKDSRHAWDRPALLDLFTYKQRQNKIVGI